MPVDSQQGDVLLAVFEATQSQESAKTTVDKAKEKLKAAKELEADADKQFDEAIDQLKAYCYSRAGEAKSTKDGASASIGKPAKKGDEPKGNGKGTVTAIGSRRRAGPPIEPTPTAIV
jgi:hypothetical protein